MTSILNTKTPDSAFQLKGGIYTLTTLELHTGNEQVLLKQLSDMISKAPRFFMQTPVVLALDKMVDQPLMNLSRIRHILHESGLILVAIRGGNDYHKKDAAISGIGWLPAQKQKIEKNIVMMSQHEQDVPVETLDPETEPEIAQKKKPATIPIESKIIHRPVRSGQQIYSAGDLIVLGPVSAGAELLAAGHIHAYGPLRGRALAGVNGNKNASVFCNHFEAELISICGQYKLTNKVDKTTWGNQWGKSAFITLDNGHLQISPLS